jgi:acyl-CoA thioesterase-1
VLSGFSPRHLVVALVATALLSTVLGLTLSARGAEVPRCQRFAAASAERAEVATGTGQPVVVIGDSWSVGLGLDAPAAAWPARLPGRVSVAGFSGSGFSAGASECGDVSFASRARTAVAAGADLVVVEGGLNDVDQPAAEVRAGFRALMSRLDGLPIVVIGPASAPARAEGVPAADRLLSRLAARHGAAYVRTADWALPYLGDGLHLTTEGHRTFGDRVAAALP